MLLILYYFAFCTNLFSQQFAVNFYQIELEGNTLATGFVIDSNSKYLITNAHVYGTYRYLCKKFYISKGKVCPQLTAKNDYNELLLSHVITLEDEYDVLQTNEVITDRNLDFALISFEYLFQTEKHQEINVYFEDLPQNNEEIYLLGYLPDSGLLIEENGIIVDTSYFSTKRPAIHYYAVTVSGMSGAGVFNMKNELIALHFGSILKEKNIKQAVPMYYIYRKYFEYFNLPFTFF